MKVVSAFHTRNSEWILPLKLHALTSFCDEVLVLIDRSPQSEAVCRRFPKVHVRHWLNTQAIPDYGREGPLCEEGRMRQAAWDWAMEYEPDFVVLGDTDEIPTPHIVPWLKAGPDPATELWYADWVNLRGSPFWHVAGKGHAWSWQNPRANKKGMVVRVVPGRRYQYNLAQTEHTRLEPNPLNRYRAVVTKKHRLLKVPKLLHYKWADLARWKENAQYQIPKYRHAFDGARIQRTPPSWLWIIDADELIASLKEPIAVVGNGELRGAGAVIDRHATVVRFNNWPTMPEYAEHVGRRCDLWVTNCRPDVVKRAWTGPILTTFTAQERPENVEQWLAAYPHMAIPRFSWANSARRIQPHMPSTGLLFLARLLARSPRPQVRVFGFDGIRTEPD